MPEVADAICLKELDLFNMGRIDSLKFVEALPELERVRLSGSTEVGDGDLAVLTLHPNLKAAAFTPKNHYNITPIRVNEILRTKWL